MPEESIVTALPLASSTFAPAASSVTVLAFASVTTMLPASSSSTTLWPERVFRTFWAGVAPSGRSPGPHHVPVQIG